MNAQVRSTLLICIVLIGILPIIPGHTAIITGTPPQPGDTIISDISVWKDEVIHLNQSLIVQSGGKLTIENSILYMNCTNSHGEYYIRVENGGILDIISGSTLTNIDPSYRYDFWYVNGSSGLICNSTIEHAGYSGGSSGLRISTDGVVVENATIKNSLSQGIYVNASSPIIRNSNFINNSGNGIYIYSSSPIIDNVFVKDSTKGIYTYFSTHNITNSTFVNASQQGVYVRESNIDFINCNFTSNDVGTYVVKSKANLINCNFTSNSIGAEYNWESNGKVENCNFSFNTNIGLYIYGLLTVSDSIFERNFWGLILKNSENIIKVKGCTLDSNERAIQFYLDSSYVENCTIFNSTSFDLFFRFKSHPTLLNTTFDESKVYYEDTLSDLKVVWFLHVYVQTKYSIPVPNANVTVWDNNNGSYTDFKTTDSSGFVRWFKVKQYFQTDNNGDHDGNDSDEMTFYTPLTLRAVNLTSHNYTSAYLNSTGIITITLDEDTLPSSPTSLDISRIGPDIVLDWTAPYSQDITFYNIYRDMGRQVDTAVPYSQSFQTTWTDADGASDYSTFYYIVRAVDGAGQEEENNETVWNGDWYINDTQSEDNLDFTVNGNIIITENGSLLMTGSSISCWDIIVSGDLFIQNSIVTVYGDLTIYNAGILELENTIFQLNGTAQGQRSIRVKYMGTLNIMDGSNIRSQDPTFNYNFWYESGSIGNIAGSVIENAGHSGGSKGLEISSDDILIQDTLIKNSYRGVSTYYSSPQIFNCNFSEDAIGILIEHGSPTISDSMVYSSSGDGVYSSDGDPTICNVTIIDSSAAGFHMSSPNWKPFTITDMKIISSGTYGIWMVGSSKMKVVNSSIEDSGDFDIKLDDNSRLFFTNTSCNQSSIQINSKSELSIAWFLHVNVEESIGVPAVDSTVRVRDSENGTSDVSYTTDTSGFVRWIEAVQLKYTSSGVINYCPYNIYVNKPGVGINEEDVQFHQNKQVSLMLLPLKDPFIESSDISLSDGILESGESVILSVTIHNLGNPTSGVDVKFYISDPDTDGDMIPDGNSDLYLLGTNTVDIPSGTYEVSITWISNTSGYLTLWVWIDPGNNVPELNDVNNLAYRKLTPPHAPFINWISVEESFVNFTWDPPDNDGGSNVKNYIVYRGSRPETAAFFTRLDDVQYFNDTTGTPYQDYYYQVSAVNNIGEGPRSNEVRAYVSEKGLPWTMFHKDPKHTGYSPVNTSLSTNTIKWTYSAGNRIASSAAVGHDGTVYIGHNNNRLAALYGSNGSVKWTFITGNKIISSPAVGFDGTIYFGSCDGKVYAVSPEGKEKWSYQTGGWIYSSPTIDNNNIVYVGSEDRNLYAFYHNNGTVKWFFRTGANIQSSVVIGNDGTVYFGSFDRKFYALYPENGTEKWNYTTGSGMFSSPAIDANGIIYFGSLDDHLYALYPNGTLKWKYNAGGDIYTTPAIGKDGMIYFAYNYIIPSLGWKYAFLRKLTPNGTNSWRFDMRYEVYSSPVIAGDGTVYIGAYGYSESESAVYAIRPNGQQRWKYATYSSIQSTPTIDTDGTIYIGCDNGILYAFVNDRPDPPNPPENLTVETGNLFFNLTWDAPSDDGGSSIIGYKIYRGTKSTEALLLETVGNQTYYYDTDVTLKQRYYFRVSAINDFGESNLSEEIYVVIGGPTAPRNFEGTGGEGVVGLTWDVPLSDGGFPIQGYNIYRSDYPGIYNTVPAGQLWYDDFNVENGITYTYNITAFNEVSEGPSSIWVMARPHGPDLSIGSNNITTYPFPITDGASSNITVTINNNGDSNVLSIPVMFYQGDPDKDNDYIIDDDAISIDSTMVDIPSHFFVDISLEWIAPSIGDFDVYVWVNPLNANEEPDEDNNLQFTTLKVFSWSDSFDNETRISSSFNINVTEGKAFPEDFFEGEIESEDILIPPNNVWSVMYIDKLELSDTFINVTIIDSISGEPVAGFINLTGSLIDLTGLDPVSHPRIRLRADLVGNGIDYPILYYWAVDWIDTTPPDFGGIVSAIDKGTSSDVELRWDPAIDPNKPITYNIYISTTQGSYDFSSPDYTTQDTYLNLQGLINGVNYWFVVRAQDIFGNGETNTIEKNCIPSAPDDVPPSFGGLESAVDMENGGNVALSWSIASDLDTVKNKTDPHTPIFYNIYISTVRGIYDFSTPNYTTLNTTFTVTGLTNNLKYWFVVRAADSVGNEDGNTIELNATPRALDKTPPVFSGLSDIERIDNLVNLSWSAAYDPDTPHNITDPHLPITYSIYISITQGNYDYSSPDYTTQALYYVVEGLSPEMQYWFVVRASDSIGNQETNENEGNITLTLSDQIPARPEGLSVVAIDNGDAIRLEWSANTETDLVGYNIYRSETSGTDYILIDHLTGTQTIYEDHSIIEGGTYFYVIDAFDELNQTSLYSDEVEITANIAPITPIGLDVSFYTTKTLNITWNANSDDDLKEYALYYSTDGIEFSLLFTIPPDREYYIHSDLKENMTYYYRLSARDEVPNESDHSQTVQGYVEVDTDKDGDPDVTDPDDDNDGLTDIEEIRQGTDPKKMDTDGDGFDDNEDRFPLDSGRWEEDDLLDQNMVLIVLLIIAVVIVALSLTFLARNKKKQSVKEQSQDLEPQEEKVVHEPKPSKTEKPAQQVPEKKKLPERKTHPPPLSPPPESSEPPFPPPPPLPPPPPPD